MPFDAVRSLFHENPPPLIHRFLRNVGKGINHYGMIGAGDRVLLSISGGKDSLVLALGLKLRLRFIPIHYDLEAVLIDFREHPHGPGKLDRIEQYFEALQIPFRVITADMRPESFGGRFDCYRCSRNRRRILFDQVRSWDGVPKIATGHHMDDVAETTLINVLYRGSFGTMLPVQPVFDGAVEIVRPMWQVPEEQIEGVVRDFDLPVSSIDCPFKDTNVRNQVKGFIREARSINPNARESILRSHTNINHEYLPDR